MTRTELELALQANNAQYRTFAISRTEWTARNRELNALGRPLGLELPEFGLTDRSA